MQTSECDRAKEGEKNETIETTSKALKFSFTGPACKCSKPTQWWNESNEETIKAKDEGPKRFAPCLMNTFTKTKIQFKALAKNRVGWYICGPTVYDSAHMGHARNYVNFDCLRRVMQNYFGYDVRFVMNVTDVDDKIIMRAHQRRAEYVVRIAEEVDGDNELIREIKELMNEGKQSLADVEDKVAKLADMLGEEAFSDNNNTEGGMKWSIQDGYLKLAQFYEREFMEDMKLMGVKNPDCLTRVSEYTEQIVQYIEGIVSNGYAYESNGSVYFDVTAFESSENHKYAKLKKSALDDVEAAMDGEGKLSNTESEKRNDFDFVLWKKSKKGEPSWPSKWGMGRPGWHIECSAMCSDVLGKYVDVNGGGIDLSFPHHENQLAQSEAHYDIEQWVNFFAHSGHLHIDGLKMSKSLKNFITIRQALKTYSARQLRFLFLLHNWSDPMELTPIMSTDGSGAKFKQMDAAIGVEKTFAEFFHSVKGALRRTKYACDKDQIWRESEKKLSDALDSCQKDVHEALLDNINTSNAVSALLAVVKEFNSYIASVDTSSIRPFLVESLAKYVTYILNCFGISGEADAPLGFTDIETMSEDNNQTIATTSSSSASANNSIDEILAPTLDVLTQFRDEIRKLAKENATSADILKMCDFVRDISLPQIGVKLDDKPDGKALWKLYAPGELLKEKAREDEERERKQLQKEKLLEEKRKKDEENKQKAKTPASEMFKTNEYVDVYGSFDSSGVPLTLKDGSEISKSNSKKLAKLHLAQTKLHDAYLRDLAASQLSQSSIN